MDVILFRLTNSNIEQAALQKQITYIIVDTIRFKTGMVCQERHHKKSVYHHIRSTTQNILHKSGVSRRV